MKITGTDSRAASFCVVKMAANVAPEFLHDKRDRVVADLRAPHLRRIQDGAVASRMVAVSGYGGRHRAAENFGKVELGASRIGAGDENAADRVSGSMPKASLAEMIVAGILLENRREHGLGHKVFNRAIGEGRADPLPVTLGALAEPRLAVLRLAHAGQKGVPGEFHPIEGAARNHSELGAGAQPGNVLGVDGKEIGERPEEAIVGCSSFFFARDLALLLLAFLLARVGGR